MTKEKKNTAVRSLLAWLIITAMVFAAEITENKEIIFPEIAALAVGLLLAPKLPWRTSGAKTVIFITLCAVLGLAVSVCPGPAAVKLTAAYIIGQAVFLASGTTLAPMLSAILLPVLLGTDSAVYPIAAFCLTAAIVLLRRMLSGAEESAPVRLLNRQELILAALRTAFMAAFTYAALKSGMTFCIAPPLLVAFTEFSRAADKSAAALAKKVAVITVCALIGMLGRYFLVMRLGLPLTAGIAMSAAVMIAFLNYAAVYIPPAGAMTALAFLIGENAVLLYPLQVLICAAVLAASAAVIGKIAGRMSRIPCGTS